MMNVLSILFCLSLFYVAVTSRVKAYVNVLRLQGLILAVLLIIPFIYHFSVYGIIIPVTVLLIKVYLIPRYINKVILDLDIKRRIEPTVQQMVFMPLVIASMIVIFMASSLLAKSTELDIIPFASGFSAIVVGIYIIMFRKKLIVHVCGFLILENGIFLFSTAVAAEMPMMIELGTLLDVFVVVFLMGIALNKINSTFEGFEVTHLGRLKD
jgi:hydrogenase-4 component E